MPTPVVPDDDDDDYGMRTPFVSLGSSETTRSSKVPLSAESQKQSAIDITAEDLIPRLTPQNVSDLVLLSMVSANPRSYQVLWLYVEPSAAKS